MNEGMATNNEPEFRIGDVVTFTNDYGVKFAGKTIVRIEKGKDKSERRYFYAPTDTPWFGVKETSLGFN